VAAVEHWDRQYSRGGDAGAGGVRKPNAAHPYLDHALEHFGDVSGRTVIDLGCGRGAASLFFAERGAHVLAVDTSEVAISNLARYCEEHGIDNVDGRVLSAMDIDQLGAQDLVYGSLILHHLEPFDEFVRRLRAAIRPGGKGYFYENNAASRTMVWFRRNVVGKLWVPKHGDDDEFPLTPDEVDELRKHFTVQQEFPELLYFELASAYLTKGKLERPTRKLDQTLHRFESIRRYSYRQELRLS
jgi:2-polyprenyl-3-methyl-5-hydroxy-6-metoxy-1,4-benzoquinol methylase